MKVFFLISLFSTLAFAKLDKLEEQGLSRELFSFKEVCNSFGVKDALLIDKKDSLTIDCMGSEFPIDNFCTKKFPKAQNYTMARFDLVDKKVACVFAETVIVGITCDKKHKHYCKNVNKTCLDMKVKFARNLELAKSMLLESFPPKIKCFFASKNKITL